MEDFPSRTLWVKYGSLPNTTTILDSILVFGHGCYFSFYDTIKRTQLYYCANGNAKGDGISCFNGHKAFPILAFAELCLDPRIIIMSYPECEHIIYLENGAPDGYLQIGFVHSEYLITLTAIPTFNLIVWAWRTGEKLVSTYSDFPYTNQYLLCTSVSHVFVQISKFGIRNLKIWSLYACGKHCALDCTDVYLLRSRHGLCSICWTADNQLLILDTAGDIYKRKPHDKKTELLMKWEFKEGIHIPEFTIFKNTIILMGPSAELVKFKFNESTLAWEIEWQIELETPIYKMKYNESINTTTAMTTDGRVCLIQNNGTIQYLEKYPSGFMEFAQIWPIGEYMVTITKDTNIFSTWKLSTGEMLATLDLMRPIIRLKSNTIWPLVALGSEDGHLIFINCYIITEPTIISMIRLSKNPIDFIRFTTDSRIWLAGNCTQGNFFLLSGTPIDGWTVFSYFELRTQCIVANVVSVEDHLIKVYAHQVTSRKYAIGNQVYTLTFNSPETITEKTRLEPKRKVAKLTYYYNKIMPDEIKYNQFYGIPYRSRTLHILILDKNEEQFSINQVIDTGHQIRLYNLFLRPQHVLSIGCDGYVFIYDKNRENLLFKNIHHHRFNNGIWKATVNAYCRYIVSQGYNKTLVCTEVLRPNEKADEIQKKLQKQFNSLKDKFNVHGVPGSGIYVIQVQTNTKTTDGDKTDSSLDIFEYLKSLSIDKIPTWLEVEQQNRLLQEAIQCAFKRQEILIQIKKIKNRINVMLDENEIADELEKLPIKEFNLDEEWIETSQMETNEECTRQNNYLQSLIKTVNSITEKIKKRCWETSKVKHQTIHAFYATLNVHNFPIGEQTEIKEMQIQSMIRIRDTELYLSRNDMFKPWQPYKHEHLQEYLKEGPQIYSESETNRLLGNTLYDDIHIINGSINPDKKLALDEINRFKYGTTTHVYVDTSEIVRYSQFENHTFFQFEQTWAAKEYYLLELRNWFNQKFDEMKATKDQTLVEVNEKIARFRNILSELNNSEITIEDPFIPDTEHPEKIMTVEPNEVPVKPYISPSEQALIEAEEAERERIRQLMLADDFREKALIKMMDGVLEIRWEDEIKKDIPMPQCMIDKDPKKYTEDDLREIAKYHEKVEFRMSERERYKRMLENEYATLAAQFRQNILKFNDKLSDLYLLKLKVLSATKQERFHVVQLKCNHYEAHRLQQKQIEIRNEIEDWSQSIEQISLELTKMNHALYDLRSNLEIIRNKDQQLEKNYRKDLPRISNALVEVYFKVLKRRPRYVIKSTSAILHYQLSKCIVSGHRPAGLPIESLEYLKSLELLDTMVGVPNTVQEEHYDIIRKIRRVKIENELKLRGNQLEIAEGEQTIVFYNRKLAAKREIHDKAVVSLRQLQQDYLRKKHDIQIQLVLKQGYVEVPQTGNICDFDEVILINRDQVEDLNRLIKIEGEIKLKAMTKDMIFRRSILQTEWLHEYKCMEIEDLKNKIQLISRIKLYRDVMDVLKLRASNESLDKGLTSLDKEEERIRKEYMKLIGEYKQKLQELDERIIAKRADNERLNERIRTLKIDVYELKYMTDMNLKIEYEKNLAEKMKCLYKRSKLLKKIQEQYNEIVVLQTELELLRLRTYPTLKYKPFVI